MKRKAFLATTILVLGLGCSITAYAQPKTMPDGTVFDAEFYAATYPDVVAVYGTNENSLYQHYLEYGASEGRMAVSASTPNSPTVTQATSLPGKETYDKYKPTMNAYIIDVEGRFIDAAAIENDYDAVYQMYIDGVVTGNELEEIWLYLDAIHPEERATTNNNDVIISTGATVAEGNPNGFASMN